MTNKTKPIAGTAPEVEIDPEIVDTPQLPYATLDQGQFVYFDHVSSFGVANGIAQLTLEAHRLRCDDGRTAVTERVMVSHLRCALPVLAQLRSSIDGIFKLAEQQAAAADASAAAEMRRLN